MRESDWTREVLLDTSGGFWKTCALHAAVKLDLFTLIGDKVLTAAELAAKAECDERGLATLLNALVSVALLGREEQGYRNTPASFDGLSKKSEHYVGFIVQHHAHLMQSWAQADTAVKTGKPIRAQEMWRDESEREAFVAGMHGVGMANAPHVTAQLDLAGSRRLLDLGGGSGIYAIHFCLATPGLTATVFDLPETRPYAEKTIAQYGVGARVEFQAGNYLQQPIEGRYDVAWISQVLHAEGPEEGQRILAKAAAALEPGGRLLVHEFLLEDTLDGPENHALFSLNMLICTPHGQAFSTAELKEMLERAGLQEVRRLEFGGPGGSGIVCGVKPA